MFERAGFPDEPLLHWLDCRGPPSGQPSPGRGRCLAAQRSSLRRKSFSFSATRRIATTKEHHVSLRRELPNLRSITVASESFHQLAGTVAAPPAKRSHARPATPYIAFTSVPPNDSPKRVLIRL